MGCLTSEQFDLLRRAAAPSTDLAAWWRHIDTCDACARRIIEGTRRFTNDSPTVVSPGLPAGSTESTALDERSPGPLPDVPGYQLVRELHRGGQGVVYLAIQKSTKREVAIKVMLQGPFAGPNDRARFEREVSILARIEHPNIVTIHDSGVASGAHYFVMRYVAGVALDAWVKSYRDDRERVLRLFIEICDAVEAAHARGVVHRDLKPGNIRVGADDRPAVLDFGLAKIAEGSGLDAFAVTQTGQFMGSVPWASPEQAAGESSRIGPRSDVYAIGVMLFHALTAQFPYSVEGNVREVLDRVRFADALRPSSVVRRLSTSGASRQSIDHELDTIVLTCLRKEPERRYASAGALAADLRRYLAGESIVARGESIGYLVTSRSARFMRRNPLAASLGGIALATLIGLTVGIPLAFFWTPAQRWFEGFAFSTMPLVRRQVVGNVAVIDLHKGVNLEALADLTEVDRTAATGPPRWPRAVHGALMERIASASPRAVAWNIVFAGESAYDAAFVRGVERLTCPVVTALPTWADDGPSILSRTIAAATAQGCDPSGFGPPFWSAIVAILRGEGEPLRSLALQAYILSRQPKGAVNDVRVDRPLDTIEVHYWAREATAGRRTSLGVCRVGATTVRPSGPNTEGKSGIGSGDELVHAALAVPSNAVLAAATTPYEKIFTMSQAELLSRFGDKIVLIGDSRDPNLLIDTPDGRKVWAAYGQALAIECLCKGTGIVVPGRWNGRLMTVAFAALGLLLGRRRPGRIVLRLALYVAAVVVCVAACLISLWWFHLLYSPVIAVVACVAGASFGEMIHTARARGLSGMGSGGSSGSWEVGT